MPPPQFSLDERAVICDVSRGPDFWASTVNEWLSTAEIIQSCNLPQDIRPVVWVTNEFWGLAVAETFTLGEVLFDSEWGAVARDEVLRLQRVLDRCSCFDPADIPNINIPIEHGHAAALCVSWSFGGFVTRRTLEEVMEVPGWQIDMHAAIRVQNDVHIYYRLWAVRAKIDKVTAAKFLQYAFPNLYVHRMDEFEQVYTDYAEILDHLAFLNDHVQELFTRFQGQPRPIQDEARAKFNIDLSPDSPNTHANINAMRERDILVGGKTIRCEWHTKFFFDCGRIHFHPGIGLAPDPSRITKGRVVVGVFAHHLTT